MIPSIRKNTKNYELVIENLEEFASYLSILKTRTHVPRFLNIFLEHWKKYE